MGLDITGLGSIADLVKDGIDKIWPNKSDEEKAKAAQLMLQVQGEIDNAKAQLDVNKQEAASSSVFVAGWRPFIGWVCGSAFAWAFVLQPFFVFVAKLMHSDLDAHSLPALDFNQIQPVLYGMLGLGAMRTYERVKGAIPPLPKDVH